MLIRISFAHVPLHLAHVPLHLAHVPCLLILLINRCGRLKWVVLPVLRVSQGRSDHVTSICISFGNMLHNTACYFKPCHVYLYLFQTMLYVSACHFNPYHVYYCMLLQTMRCLSPQDMSHCRLFLEQGSRCKSSGSEIAKKEGSQTGV